MGAAETASDADGSQSDRPAPELTVVVCSIGKAPVERCIASVIESAGPNASIEILLIWQARRPAPELPPVVRVVPTFPAGVAYARNKGVDEAAAPIVAFIDDDEVADSNWVPAAMQACAAHTGADAVFGAVEPLDDDGRPYCNYAGTVHRVFDSPRTPPWVIGTEGNMAFRTDALREVGSFDLTFGIGAPSAAGEGADLIVRLLADRKRVEFAPDMVVFHPTKNRAERLASRYPYGYGMGKVIRRHRDPILGAKYAVAGLQNLTNGVRSRDSQRTTEAVRTLRGFSAAIARRTQWRAPLAHVALAPGPIVATFDGAPIVPLPTQYRARPHLVYAVGDELMLHVYVSPTPDVIRSHHERELIRRDTDVVGIPRVVAIAEEEDVLWIVEDRVPGTPPRPGRSPETWFRRAIDWSVALARPSGPALQTVPAWEALRRAVVDSVPKVTTEAVAAAFDEVGTLPAVHVHGDFERKNLHLHDGELLVVDWETAEWRGIPGQDLLFLTATATHDRCEAEPLADVLRGREPAFGAVLGALEAVGVDRSRLDAVVLVLLARWRLQERERLGAPGSRPISAVQDALFGQLVPLLTGIHLG